MRVKRYSNATASITVAIANRRELLPMNEMMGYLVCEYDKQWWLAFVLNVLPETEELRVRFLHPAGPAPSFVFPKRNDDLVIARSHVIMTVNPTTSTGRTYQLPNEVAAEAEIKLKQKIL